MLSEIVRASRSYRRFDERVRIPMRTLEELIDLARLCPSAANKQPLRFALCADPEENARIFECLKWAAYLTDWTGPQPGERPSAYIIILNTAKSWEFAKYDQGIMAQTILLGAVEQGLGGCMIGSMDREKLGKLLELEEEVEICLVLALGKPVEDVRIVELPEDGSIKYYRDAAGVHYVPKRSRTELIVRKRG